MRKERILQLLEEANINQERQKLGSEKPSKFADNLLRILGANPEFIKKQTAAMDSSITSKAKKHELICNAAYAASLFSANFNSIAFRYKRSHEAASLVRFTYENWEDIKCTWTVIKILDDNDMLVESMKSIYHLGELIVENHEQIETVLNAAGFADVVMNVKDAVTSAGFSLILTAGKIVLFVYNRKDKNRLSELRAIGREIEVAICLLNEGIPPNHIRPKLAKINRELWKY